MLLSEVTSSDSELVPIERSFCALIHLMTQSDYGILIGTLVFSDNIMRKLLMISLFVKCFQNILRSGFDCYPRRDKRENC